ncbi:MAG: helix-turn-helix transcriptional regulator [Streptococcus orisratti]|uniref:helix-turn-helix domain-containing protein n=1 Tax=Streptococcus orisratti TaxID=114652 RepID=UPI002A9165BF|nr:helix-turn-helix transcriptional regulator [Streptococcus orisratti]MDY5636071.1 helix-turn-helix transcriptional regulator [Streptococcus orisratti]
MSNFDYDKSKKIYFQLLGKEIKSMMNEKGIKQNQIGEGEEQLPESTVNQILQGKRNLTYNSLVAFQVTLGMETPKNVCFPSQKFCSELITKILKEVFQIQPTSTTKINDFVDKYSDKIFNNMTDYPESSKETFDYFYNSFIIRIMRNYFGD